MRTMGDSTWRVNRAEKEQIQKLIRTKGFCELQGFHGTVKLTANTLIISEIGFGEYEVGKLNKPDYANE